MPNNDPLILRTVRDLNRTWTVVSSTKRVPQDGDITDVAKLQEFTVRQSSFLDFEGCFGCDFILSVEYADLIVGGEVARLMSVVISVYGVIVSVDLHRMNPRHVDPFHYRRAIEGKRPPEECYLFQKHLPEMLLSTNMTNSGISWLQSKIEARQNPNDFDKILPYMWKICSSMDIGSIRTNLPEKKAIFIDMRDKTAKNCLIVIEKLVETTDLELLKDKTPDGCYSFIVILKGDPDNVTSDQIKLLTGNVGLFTVLSSPDISDTLTNFY